MRPGVRAKGWEVNEFIRMAVDPGFPLHQGLSALNWWAGL